MGSVEDVTGLIVFLASDTSAGITGQAIGIGGDKLSLWSHPSEVALEYSNGGWSADSIAAAWGGGVGKATQTYGIPMPASPGN